jgi:hypothetical protein
MLHVMGACQRAEVPGDCVIHHSCDSIRADHTLIPNRP